jgi:ATP-dependent protease ClpP protease subunit
MSQTPHLPPMPFAQSPMGNPTSEIFNRLLKDRIIILGTDVNDDIAIQAEQLIYIKRLMAERIAHHTGQTVEQIQEDSERDRWFTAEQAKEYGIIDHVREKRSDVVS